jgi:hypothetical protein
MGRNQEEQSKIEIKWLRRPCDGYEEERENQAAYEERTDRRK